MNANSQQPRTWQEAMDMNKATIFRTLAAVGITEVTIEYDGYGDSGQIESLTLRAGEKGAELPNENVTLYERSGSYQAPQIIAAEHSLRDAVETFCFDCLEDRHPGWEIEDGSSGTFHFDVPGGKIQLDYYQRIIEAEQDEF